MRCLLKQCSALNLPTWTRRTLPKIITKKPKTGGREPAQRWVMFLEMVQPWLSQGPISLYDYISQRLSIKKIVETDPTTARQPRVRSPPSRWTALLISLRHFTDPNLHIKIVMWCFFTYIECWKIVGILLGKWKETTNLDSGQTPQLIFKTPMMCRTFLDYHHHHLLESF